jgi:NodT family efflux transporter outer membrane factor (OMF) lipoprotein
MKILIHSFRALPALVVLLSGCAVGPDYAGPREEPTQAGWTTPLSGAGEEALPVEDFWAAWEAPQLDALLAAASATNRDLAQARARLDEALARRGVARSALSPQVDAVGSWARRRASENGAQAAVAPPGRFDPLQTVMELGLEASWEIDLFGYNRRRVEAAVAGLEGTAAELAATRLAIRAETALAFLEWSSLEEALSLATERLALQRRTLAIVEAQVGSGLADELALLSARREVRAAEAEIPALENGRQGARQRLAVLTGQTPADFTARFGDPAALPAGPPALPRRLPAEVVRARPDVLQAERALAAAYAELGAAEAEVYPRLRLTGALGWESLEAEDLIGEESLRWLIAPSVHFPLFQGGRMRRQEEAAAARLEGAQARYEAAVLRALADVETSLAAYRLTSEQARRLDAASSDARSAESRAQSLYEAGLATLETLLEASRQRSRQEAAALQARTAALSQAVRYFKAIGGAATIETEAAVARR